MKLSCGIKYNIHELVDKEYGVIFLYFRSTIIVDYLILSFLLHRF